jgi:hypothetical protein
MIASKSWTAGGVEQEPDRRSWRARAGLRDDESIRLRESAVLLALPFRKDRLAINRKRGIYPAPVAFVRLNGSLEQ